jgi:hypothetical protein
MLCDVIWFFIDALDLHRVIRHDLHLSTGTAPSPRCHRHVAVVSTKQLTVSTISHHTPRCKTKLDASTFIILQVLCGF